MKKTKVLSILLVVTILFSLVQPIISYAEDATAVTLKYDESNATSLSLVNVGDIITVNLELSNTVVGYKSLAGTIAYDTDKLEPTTATYNNNGDLTDANACFIYDENASGYLIANKYNDRLGGGLLDTVVYDQTENKMTFASTSSSPKFATGRMYQLKFRVKSGATGTFRIYFEGVRYENDGGDAATINSSSVLTGTIKTPLTSISLSDSNVILAKDGTKNLSVTYNPTITTDSKTVNWSSSDTTVATVDNNGKVTAKKVGTATITATSTVNAAIKATCAVRVTSELQSIALNKSSVEMAKGQTEQLTVTYNPTNTTDSKVVNWTSSNTDVATVDNNGKVTAKALGTTVITATSAKAGIPAATCTVSVTSKLQKITWVDNTTTTNIEINKGTNKTLEVKFVPEDTTDSKTINWTSSDSTIATVDRNGNVVAIKPGRATITANCNGKIATATIDVKSPLTSISIVGGNRELLPEQEVSLSVTYNPTDTTNSRTIQWSSSNPEFATVDSNGKVTAIKPGTTTITAKCGTITNQITVKVNEVHMEGIAFRQPELIINKGNTIATEILFIPSNTTDSRVVSYSSADENIAIVDASGKVTAKAVGTTTITATSNEKTAQLTVNVKQPLTGISLNKESLTIIKGTTEGLTVSYNEDDTTDDKTVTWVSLNPTVATVDSIGNVTAKAGGTAIIKAKVGRFEKTCTVNVRVPLTGISIKNTLDLLKNQEETLVVTYNPADTTDSRKINWTISDNTVATVDSNGKVRGLREGTATVTATSQVTGIPVSTCTVSVTEIHTTGIAISNKKDKILKGQEHKLELLFTPENTTDDKDAEWTSSDESVLTVDENGVVKGLKEGKATVTVRVRNNDINVSPRIIEDAGEEEFFEDSYEITVEEIKLQAIEIETPDNSKTITKGTEIQLGIKFTPEDTTDSRIIKFMSSDPSIIQVDENGVAKGLKVGKAIITAVAENGIQTQIELTVEADKTEEQPKVDSPRTGDINLTLYVVLMIISLAGIIKIRKNNK